MKSILSYLDSYLLTDTTGNSNSVTYDSQDCIYCLNKVDSANNAKMTAYAAGVLALVVAYMANNAVSSLHQNTLRSALKNLKYFAIIVLIVGFLSTFLFYTTWSDALIQDEVALSSTNSEGSDSNKELGCIKNLLTFYGEGNCEEYVQLQAGEADRITGRLGPVSWSPGIGFFIVLIGTALTGGGTLYILGNIDEEWQAILKKQELIERQQKIHDGELEKSKELMQEFEDKKPEIIFEWQDSHTTAKGWIVINSLRGGAAAGGTRMRVGVTKNEVLSLAKTMEIKFAVAGPDIGGGKSGIDFDPRDPRKEEVLKRWFKAASGCFII